MGFIIKSAFWLGVVYWAMPFDQAPISEAGVGALCPNALTALPDPLKPAPGLSRELAAAGCAALTAKVASALARPQNDGMKPAGVARAAATASPDYRDRRARRVALDPKSVNSRHPNKG